MAPVLAVASERVVRDMGAAEVGGGGGALVAVAA
jgi:hypothetical protein